jgi:ubiquinone biosynthesis monooxygenase Coq6
MAAVDKLHKIYSSTYEPLVWARSVGLEVLNEFDSLKAAIMMNAGAHGSDSSTSTTGWSLAAKGVESLAAGTDVAKMVGRGVVDIVGTELDRFLKTTRSK